MHYPDYVIGEHFISFLGGNLVESTARILLDEAESTTAERSLQLVPEIGALALRGSGAFEVKEEPDMSDYIISLSKLALMEGKEFRHFRRYVRAFLRENPHAQPKQLDLSDPNSQKAILKVFTEREAAKNDNDSGYELQAIKNLLQNSNLYPLITYGLEIDDQLRAFIICEVVDEEWTIGHFWKADIGYSGIYSYLMHHTSKALSQLGISKMNIQQDLGMEGLRRFKNFMRPVASLKKYTIIDG